jgi:hypothetical protein
MTWDQLNQLKLLLGEAPPKSAYLFSEIPGQQFHHNATANDETFVFQYWPETVEVGYTVNYAAKSIPGASHDLQQWTGGTGRDITFTTVFTAEVNRDRRSPLAPVMPSARYTVDVRGAASYLQSLMLGSYGKGGALNGLVSPPKKLYLVLEGTGLGGDGDAVLVILRSAPITYEAWFPDGKPRIVAVSCTFTEIVQRSSSQQGGSSIQYVGREVFEQDGAYYKYRGTVDRTMG